MATTVFRVEKNREFVVMNNKFLREREMSLKAKGLLALCLSLPETWEYSINGLVSICKESQTSMRSALKELEKFGYLKRNRLKDDKGMFYYEYVLYEVPYEGFVYAGNQVPENANAGKEHTENDRQLNIKKKIIKKENKEDTLYIEQLAYLEDNIVNQELRNYYVDYITMRRNIDAPLTMRGLEMIINRTERLSNFDIELQKALLEAATINEWKNTYLPNEQEVQNNTTLASLRRKYSR